MPETPVWAQTIAFWLHMLATVSWIGGQALLSLVILPISQKTLETEKHYKLVSAINKRMYGIGWLSLAVLLGTGMLQMGANENYQGFLATGSTWAQAILLKHIAFAAILGLTAYQTWKIAPDLERQALLQTRGKGNPEEQLALRKKEARTIRINLILSILVLAFTALARVS